MHAYRVHGIYRSCRREKLLGSLSNHDEGDDDDVKYARREWDENVAFGSKMKLKQ